MRQEIVQLVDEGEGGFHKYNWLLDHASVSFRRSADQSSSMEIIATPSRPSVLAYALIVSRLMSVFTLEVPL